MINRKHNYRKDVNEIIIAILIIILSFGLGYFISDCTIMRTLNEKQIEICKQISEDIFKGEDTTKLPDGFSILENNGTTVVIKVKGYLGKVVINLENNELLYTYIVDEELIKSINCIIALFTVLLSTLIYVTSIAS